MKDVIAKLYRHIAGTGERQPTIDQVRAALGRGAPCRDLLGAWRSEKSVKIPSFEQLLYLLYMAERIGMLEAGERDNAERQWCRAARAAWDGRLQQEEVTDGN